MPHTYPLMLDVADRLIVIVGGGAVAVRKAKTLIECGATRVRCVATDINVEMPAEIERVTARYDAKHLDGAALVFAATDEPSVNASIVRDARKMNILVNRADANERDPGDFSTPARLSESAITVTVSTAGNPALAALIRDEIRNAWDERWSRMADAMQKLRPAILGREDFPEDRRRQMFRALATPEALEVLGKGDVPALNAWLAERFPELNHA